MKTRTHSRMIFSGWLITDIGSVERIVQTLDFFSLWLCINTYSLDVFG